MAAAAEIRTLLVCTVVSNFLHCMHTAVGVIESALPRTPAYWFGLIHISSILFDLLWPSQTNIKLESFAKRIAFETFIAAPRQRVP
jgi:hypothetical protein